MELAAALQKLLPSGLYWEGRLSPLLSAITAELERWQSLWRSWLGCIQPLNASGSWLTAWEQELALPEACDALDDSDAARRQRVHAKLVTTNTGTLAGLESIAEERGFQVSLHEWGGGFRVGDPVGTHCFAEANTFLFSVSGNALQVVHEFSAGDSVDSPLRTFSDTARLECLLNRYKPAHTAAHFDFT